MDIVSIIFIGIGLSMDALAVAVSNGANIRKQTLYNALKIAAFFGGFQTIMPILGWLAGTTIRDFIASFDHWLAFGILTIIGGKMILEANKLKSEDATPTNLNFYVLFMLAIATSIDALAVGLSLSFLKVFIIVPALIIGTITFLISFAGVFIGKTIGHFFENKLEIIGGLVLIGIGIKIVVEHLL